MPCYAGVGDPCKHEGIEQLENAYAQENLGTISGNPEAYFAHMGWVGYANLKVPPLTAVKGVILRCTGANINLSQDITTPNVIDGRIDRTVYQLGPKVVEGTLSMPIIADVDPNDYTGGCVRVEHLRAGASNLLQTLWCWTTARSPQGRLQWSEAALDVRYANHAAFTFQKCIANTLSMSVAQSDVISFDVNVIGTSRNMANDPFNEPLISDFLSPARVLTWNDVTITGVGGCDNLPLLASSQIREFSFEINNNAERYYSLNGRLYPIDINVSKREITGSMTLMGLQDQLRIRAEQQQDHFTRKDEIRMQFFVGDEAVSGPGLGAQGTVRDWFDNTATPVSQSGAVPFFWNKFVGVIFRIEEMSLTNEVYETTVNWLALGSDQQNYLATYPASSCDFPAWS